MFEWIIGLSVFALLVAAYMAKWVLAHDQGTPAMQEIGTAIRQGAQAFLARQYKTIAVIAVLLAILIYAMYTMLGRPDEAWRTSTAFVLGALSSAIAGYIGMQVAIRANVRTAAAASKSLDSALQLSLRAGLIPGLCVVSLSLLGISLLYLWFGADPATTPHMIVGYAFGASLVALFAQLGGGIYTKAADVGADLVGKIEAGIPEDDPRNPAVIADLVGDNVGDCAGRGADLFESITAETIGAMILGIALAQSLGPGAVLFPLLLTALCLVASIIGVLSVKVMEGGDPMAAMTRGFIVTALLCIGAFALSVWWLLNNQAEFLYAGLIGIAASLLFVYITRYYTEYKYKPVRDIAQAATTGPATVMIEGLSLGFECTALPIVVISIALWGAYYLGIQSGVAHGGLFGTALATMGMLSTAVYVLAMDNFGPISDNAGGIVEMSKASEATRKRTDKLDAAGNTTKALTKGYAVGSAALAAFLLFSAYLDQVTALTGKAMDVVNLARIEVFIAGLVGAMLVFLFASFALRAVGKTAGVVIMEVRRQFKENKGIMKGTSKPDYARCVDIITQGALKSMIAPGLLVVVVPIIVGILLRAEAMAGFLMVSTITGILLALLMNNAGGAWDNAKKYIETGVLGGKKSEAHKAAVVGDTVGDPFKDTAGPSLHVLIKMLATITLVLAPLFI